MMDRFWEVFFAGLALVVDDKRVRRRTMLALFILSIAMAQFEAMRLVFAIPMVLVAGLAMIDGTRAIEALEAREQMPAPGGFILPRHVG
jgi:hypothetical protein